MSSPDAPHLISIIIPVLNEEPGIAATLCELEPIARRPDVEIIVSDGGSGDGTVTTIEKFNFAQAVLCQQANRGFQMNQAARMAKGDILFFLHADVKLPKDAIESVSKAMANDGISGGCFQIRFPTDLSLSLQMVAWGINLRTRLFKTATGDQAIFVRRKVFNEIGGYKTYPLMEDIALFSQMKRLGKVAVLDEKVEISPRRWLKYGVWRTVMLMYLLRFGYWLGVHPEKLKRFFIDVR